MQDPSTAPYDIIFLDLEMPIMDGYEACTKINQYLDMIDEENGYHINQNKK